MRQKDKLIQTIVLRLTDECHRRVLEAALKRLIPPSRWMREAVIEKLEKET